jgi:hypothetical protein
MQIKKTITLLLFFASMSPSLFSSNISEKVKELLPKIKRSSYSHKTEIDEKNGVYNLDCSGLACFLLKENYPEVYKKLPFAKKHKRPKAIDFFNAIYEEKENNGWEKIPSMKDAAPGDFIVWKYPPAKKGDTGHLLIIMSKPVKINDSTYEVKICDSSKSRHANDTRKKGQSGIGMGTMWFAVDKDGKPNAFYWSSQKRKPRAIQIVIGRIQDKSENEQKALDFLNSN